MAWGPLAQGMHGFFDDPALKAIGAKYGKSVAQVALKFLTDEGIAVIPKSVRRERMAENLDLDGFELSAGDRDALRRMDTGHPLAADFDDPALARYLLGYDRQFNPARQ